MRVVRHLWKFILQMHLLLQVTNVNGSQEQNEKGYIGIDVTLKISLERLTPDDHVSLCVNDDCKDINWQKYYATNLWVTLAEQRSIPWDELPINQQSIGGPQGVPGAIALKGEKGLSGFPGRPGKDSFKVGYPGLPGLPGMSGLKGQPGEPCKPSFPGRTDVPRVKGDRGLPGAPGLPGMPGVKGAAGWIGLPGVPGKICDCGLPGPLGFTGQKGATGRSCLPGRTGRKGDSGLPGLPGLQGIPGSKGEPAIANFPGQSVRSDEIGDSDTPEYSGMSGMHGDMGEMGRPGFDGVNGPPGVSGSPGLTGFDGPKGESGFLNPFGDNGSPGLPGWPGMPGLNGESGKPGLPGVPDKEGARGPLGRPGLPGDSGRPGLRGVPGEEGARGPPGYPGPPGLKGDPGHTEPPIPGAEGGQEPRGQKAVNEQLETIEQALRDQMKAIDAIRNNDEDNITLVIGGVTAAGGEAAVQVVGSLSTCTLPALPLALAARPIVATVGSRVLYCDLPTLNSSSLGEFFELDVMSDHPVWQSNSIYEVEPGLINAFGVGNDTLVSITVSGTISVITQVTHDSVDRNIYNVSNIFYPDIQCFVNNATHVFAVTKQAIHVIEDITNPSNWKTIQNLTLGNNPNMACLLHDTELYITGGFVEEGKATGFNLIIDLHNFNVRMDNSTYRASHGMGVINGQPAIIGGMDINGEYLDTIEIYDVDTKSWKQRHRKLLQPVANFGYTVLALPSNNFCLLSALAAIRHKLLLNTADVQCPLTV